MLWWGLTKVEPLLTRTWPGRLLRRSALECAMKHVHYEDENTRYIDIGPVNKVMNMLCCWFEDPHSAAVAKHLPRVADYLVRSLHADMFVQLHFESNDQTLQ